MVACCMPCIVNRPALRSRALNSFISRLLFRVHAADSNEHHAVLSVANAISKAVTGSTHFFFSCGSRFDEPAGSDCLFTQSDFDCLPSMQFKNFFAHYNEEECRREPAHQNASQSLERPEQSPFFWQ